MKSSLMAIGTMSLWIFAAEEYFCILQLDEAFSSRYKREPDFSEGVCNLSGVVHCSARTNKRVR